MVDPVNRINNNRVAARVFAICLLLLTFLPGLKCAAGESDGYVTAPDGVRLFYHRLGNGPKRVLVPNGHYLIKDFSQLVDSDHTFIFYDLRNRGRSDHVSDPGKLKGGIHLDVEDLEAVRRHFNIEKAAIIGHSYVGLMVALYAMKYPMHVERLIQIDAAPPESGKEYPAHLRMTDKAFNDEIGKKVAALSRETAKLGPEAACRAYWRIVRVFYVTNPKDAVKLDGYCELPNEQNAGKYFSEYILPSIQALKITDTDVAKITMPVLVIHGTADRAVPYGAGREWALRLPRARLVTIEGGSHYSWIEAPEKVFGAIRSFLDGQWPEDAEKVNRIDPESE